MIVLVFNRDYEGDSNPILAFHLYLTRKRMGGNYAYVLVSKLPLPYREGRVMGTSSLTLSRSDSTASKLLEADRNLMTHFLDDPEITNAIVEMFNDRFRRET